MTSDRLALLALPALLALLPLSAQAGAKEDARAHYLAGLAAAEQGSYAMAIGEFLASWELFRHPSTARNIARAYTDYGDPKRALLWYGRFQELAPGQSSEVAADMLRLREELDPLPTQAASAPALVVDPTVVASTRADVLPSAELASEVDRIRASIEGARTR